MRKISSVSDENIKFTDGSVISFDHWEDCCEENYADFRQLDDLALDYEFRGKMLFEAVEGSGFRFGDSRRKFYVPCYSMQNGYYSDEIDIYYNGKKVLSFSAELIVD